MQNSNCESSFNCTMQGYPTCFVCGSPNCAKNVLFIRQTVSGVPFFPFLEHHEPPEKSVSIRNDQVLSCNVCSTLLLMQWKSYEENNTQLKKRIYFLKRDDALPYSGVEMGMQTDYASQLLGLSHDPASVDDHMAVNCPKSSKSRTSVPSNAAATLATENSQASNSTVRSTSCSQRFDPSVQVLSSNAKLSPAKVVKPNPCVTVLQSREQFLAPPEFTPVLQEVALDLSIDKRNYKAHVSPTPSSPEVLDLSMPDKNASTEVCYVCGDHFLRGTLTELLAKEKKSGPFYLTLMNHPRPSKSRPIAASGCVLACKPCHDFLYWQWLFFNEKHVSHRRREYVLKRSGPVHERTVPCNDCLTSVLFSDAVVINRKTRDYFFLSMSIDNVSKIVCSKCQVKEELSNCANYNANENNEIQGKCPKRIKIECCDNSESSNNEISIPVIKPPHPEQIEQNTVSCYICHQFHSRTVMYWMGVSGETSVDGMFFPFVKNLQRNEQSVVAEDGKVLICSLCNQHYRKIWEEFEQNKVAVSDRCFHFRTESLNSTSPKPYIAPSPLPSFLTDNSSDVLTNSSEGATKDLQKYINLHEIDLSKIREKVHHLACEKLQNPLAVTAKCCICNFDTKKGETYLVASRRQNYCKMSFLFLESPLVKYQPAAFGTGHYFLCVMCFNTLAVQWQYFDSLSASESGRLYDVHNYTCYICGLTTYRKRVKKIEVKDFPFLKEHRRPAKSLVLEYGLSVAVCQDCFIRLNQQYQDMERLGVPVDRREYNWIKKPAPPPFVEQFPAQSKRPASVRSCSRLPALGGGLAKLPARPSSVGCLLSSHSDSSNKSGSSKNLSSAQSFLPSPADLIPDNPIDRIVITPLSSSPLSPLNPATRRTTPRKRPARGSKSDGNALLSAKVPLGSRKILTAKPSAKTFADISAAAAAAAASSRVDQRPLKRPSSYSN